MACCTERPQSGFLIQLQFVSSFPFLFPNTCHFQSFPSIFTHLIYWVCSQQTPIVWGWGQCDTHLTLIPPLRHKPLSYGTNSLDSKASTWVSPRSSQSSPNVYQLWTSWVLLSLHLYCLATGHTPNDHLYHPSYWMQGCAGNYRADSSQRAHSTIHPLFAQHFTCLVGIKHHSKPTKIIRTGSLCPLYGYLKRGTEVLYTGWYIQESKPDFLFWSFYMFFCFYMCVFVCTLFMCFFCLFTQHFFLQQQKKIIEISYKHNIRHLENRKKGKRWPIIMPP